MKQEEIQKFDKKTNIEIYHAEKNNAHSVGLLSDWNKLNDTQQEEVLANLFAAVQVSYVNTLKSQENFYELVQGIYEENGSNIKLADIGSTIIGVIFDIANKRLTITNVGDSSAILVVLDANKKVVSVERLNETLHNPINELTRLTSFSKSLLKENNCLRLGSGLTVSRAIGNSSSEQYGLCHDYELEDITFEVPQGGIAFVVCACGGSFKNGILKLDVVAAIISENYCNKNENLSEIAIKIAEESTEEGSDGAVSILMTTVNYKEFIANPIPKYMTLFRGIGGGQVSKMLSQDYHQFFLQEIEKIIYPCDLEANDIFAIKTNQLYENQNGAPYFSIDDLIKKALSGVEKLKNGISELTINGFSQSDEKAKQYVLFDVIEDMKKIISYYERLLCDQDMGRFERLIVVTALLSDGNLYGWRSDVASALEYDNVETAQKEIKISIQGLLQEKCKIEYGKEIKIFLDQIILEIRNCADPSNGRFKKDPSWMVRLRSFACENIPLNNGSVVSDHHLFVQMALNGIRETKAYLIKMKNSFVFDGKAQAYDDISIANIRIPWDYTVLCQKILEDSEVQNKEKFDIVRFLLWDGEYFAALQSNIQKTVGIDRLEYFFISNEVSSEKIESLKNFQKENPYEGKEMKGIIEKNKKYVPNAISAIELYLKMVSFTEWEKKAAANIVLQLLKCELVLPFGRHVLYALFANHKIDQDLKDAVCKAMGFEVSQAAEKSLGEQIARGLKFIYPVHFKEAIDALDKKVIKSIVKYIDEAESFNISDCKAWLNELKKINSRNYFSSELSKISIFSNPHNFIFQEIAESSLSEKPGVALALKKAEVKTLNEEKNGSEKKDEDTNKDENDKFKNGC